MFVLGNLDCTFHYCTASLLSNTSALCSECKCQCIDRQAASLSYGLKKMIGLVINRCRVIYKYNLHTSRMYHVMKQLNLNQHVARGL